VPERFRNTSVTVLDPEAPFRARLINCTEHLDELDKLDELDDQGPGSAPV
jgi:hypothetical protein